MASSNKSGITEKFRWPSDDFSRIPFAAYHDRDVYEAERERIFRGPTWNYLALEIEIPNAGDFKTIQLGDIPVLVNRDRDGVIRAFINRCAHRGTILRREERGNARGHVCVYHQWAYDLAGRLAAVPFAKGVNGKGGLPPDFDQSAIGLTSLRVESFRGVIFGTFAQDCEPLLDYLGPAAVGHLERMFHKPIKLLGYQRQRIYGNWKLYNDNVRDPNHGGLLHMFHATFGLFRPNQTGGAKLDPRGRHNISYSRMGTEDAAAQKTGYAAMKKVYQENFRLLDTAMLANQREFPDDITLVIMSIFPNCVFQQIANSLCTRQIRLKGVDEFELYWTYFGYADDSEEMTEHRVLQANLVGPGGYISMEDGEAVEIVHRTIASGPQDHARVEIGGKGPIGDAEWLVTEVPIRGFWSYYHELMGFSAAEART